MNILFYTTDLFAGRERLMPWRTVLEVAKGMQDVGHQVVVVNGVSEQKYLATYIFQDVLIRGISKDLNELNHVTRQFKANILFVECKWRDAMKGFVPLKTLSCKKYAYFTGGLYDWHSVRLLSKLCGMRNARPYWMETLIPKLLVTRRLKQAKFNGVIGLTPLTTLAVLSTGYSSAMTILPGKDEFENLISDSSVLRKYQLEGKRFLCFTGAPAPTRGAQLLLHAVDKAWLDDLRVVFLMRKDVGSDFGAFNVAYKQMVHPERVIMVRDGLSREQLKAFFERAWYMVLPFVVVQSEVPLTFFEIMSCGTPVLTFANGGTSDYLKDGLMVVDKSMEGLIAGVTEAWKNMPLRAEKAERARRIMQDHPTWTDVTDQWMTLIV